MKDDSIKENFIDGRNPEDKGDMARHGLKGKTLAQLRKIRSSKSASPRKKQLAHWYINMHKEDIGEDLRKWFREKWVRMDTKGNIKGECAREPGEGKPKCLPIAKARAMDKKDRATATRRKRREDPVADRPGKGGAPVNVRTEQIEYIEEKSTPTNPELWSKAKALAKSKFDVYPSAYANGWAAKWYKSKGGGWKAVGESMETKSLADILREAKATYCGRCGTTHVAPKFGGKCPALKEDVELDEARIETDSGTANVTDTHVNFNNSGFKRRFTHQEIHKMDKGETVRGFKNEKDHPYADKHTSVYSDGDEEHHLPNDAKKSVSEERIVEVKVSTLQSYLQKRSAGRIKSAAATIFKGKDSPEVKSHEKREAGMERARKKLAPHYAAQAAERAKKQREELKKNNPPHEVKKRLDAAKAEYERSYGPVEKAGHQYAEGNGYYQGKELHAKYHALKQLHKEVSEARDWCGICGQTPCNCTNINEATSAAVRMQRALQKAKEDRERQERLAKPFVDSIFKKKEEQKPMKEQKTLKQVMEAQLHPDALHVIPTKVDGKTKYKVHAVGSNLAHGIKVGEHLTDTHLDDAAEMGARIKQVKSPKNVSEEGSWFGKKNGTKNKSASQSVTSPEHRALETRGERNKGEGTEESVDYAVRFTQLLSQHGYQQKLVEWHDSIVSEQEHIAAIRNIKKNIETRNVSTDKDTDIIRDYDEDDVRKQEVIKKNKHHHHKVKNFRAYMEDVSEAISARQALSKAADMEFKAANTDSPGEEQALKGKAKALRRAARLAQELASTVNLDVSKTK